MWDMEMKSLPSLAQGDAVNVKGTAVLYQDQIQLKVESIVRETSCVDPRRLYPSSKYSEDQLRSEFTRKAGKISDSDLGSLMSVVEKDVDFMNRFFTSPAAVTMHHARIGGLAEHSLGVCTIAESVADVYPWLRRDLIIAGSLLHDIGKVQEYEVGSSFEVTIHGQLLGHISMGLVMLEKWISEIPDFPAGLDIEVKHIILSHHGQLEHGSPRAPVIPEALVVHYADDLDAKLDMLRDAKATAGKEGREVAGSYVRGLGRFFFFPGDGGYEEEEPVTMTGVDDEDEQAKLF
jgi:3'-5' exoribonuclease